MDIILIGKASHNRNDMPTVVYCGQSRLEADAAVAATAGKFPRIYELNSEPFRPIASPLPEPVRTTIPAAPAPVEVAAAPAGGTVTGRKKVKAEAEAA